MAATGVDKAGTCPYDSRTLHPSEVRGTSERHADRMPSHRPRGRPRRPARVLVASALVLATAACGGGSGDVWLGVALPLTTADGQPDTYGENSRMGALLAAEEINAAGGVRGDSLRLRLVDDRGDDSTAIQVADSLLADARVIAVVGHVYSGTTRQAAQIYSRGLPAVATSATASDISRLGPWIFRVTSSDSANALELARAARGLGDAAAVVYANDDYGQGLMRNFASAFTGAGGRVVQADPYLEGTTRDFRPYLERLRRKGVGLVFIAGLDVGAAPLIRQAREVGLGARFMGGDGLEALVGAGPDFDGTVVGVLYHRDASDEARRFAEAYRRRWSREPDSQAALAYDAVRLLARAAADGARSREAVRGYLERVGARGGSPAFAGAAGPVAFDANGDPQARSIAVGQIRGGSVVLSNAGR